MTPAGRPCLVAAMDERRDDGGAIELLAAAADDAAAREAVLRITRAAFRIDPVTGVRIAGDTPPELPLVEALFARGAVDHLHLAAEDGRIAAYVLYARGRSAGDPGLRVQGLVIMGVEPARQRRGIGTRLLRWSVDRLRGACDLAIVLGHPAFYARAGFVEARSLGLEFPYPAPPAACRAAVLGDRPIAPGAVAYHPIVDEFV